MGCLLRTLPIIMVLHVTGIQGWKTTLKAEDVALHDHEWKLHQDLQVNYNSHVLPPHNRSNPVKVALQIYIIAIQQLDEKTESLTTDAWMKMVWNDTRIKWKTEDYGGLTTTRLPHHMIWYPDIELFNRVQLSNMDSQRDTFCVVHHTGNVDWVVPSTFHSSCSVDLKMYPFDVQSCSLTFGAWNLNGHHLDLTLVNEHKGIEFAPFFHPNNQWDITGATASHSKKYFPCCEEPFPEVNFDLRLRRRSPYYKQLVLYPTFGIVILTMATFWLPPDSMAKIILGGFNFVALLNILVHLSWKLPATGKTVPMIVTFCGHLTLIVVMSIVVSILSLIYGRAKYDRPAPRWMRTLLNSVFGKFLCISSRPVVLSTANHTNEETISSLEMEAEDLKNQPPVDDRQRTLEDYYTAEWIRGLQMVDRTLFLGFLITTVFLLASSFTFEQ